MPEHLHTHAHTINPSDTEVWICQGSYIDTMAADALAPHLPRSSLAIVSAVVDTSFSLLEMLDSERDVCSLGGN